MRNRYYVLYDGNNFYTNDKSNKHITKILDQAQIFSKLRTAYIVASTCKISKFSIYVRNTKTETLEKVDEVVLKNFIENQQPKKRKSFNQSTRKDILHKNNCRCNICGRELDEKHFTIDHIVPLAKGGGNEKTNLAPVCKQCNRIKADKYENDFYEFISAIVMTQMQKTIDSRYKQNCMKKWLRDMIVT